MKLLTQLGKFDREEYELLRKLYEKQYPEEYKKIVNSGYKFKL